MCSLWVINPDRTWIEPWRFITYGFVHNSWTHLISNIMWQLLFGLPLELSNGSRRVASVFLSGVFLGGLGREMVVNSSSPLAGASGETPLLYP